MGLFSWLFGHKQEFKQSNDETGRSAVVLAGLPGAEYPEISFDSFVRNAFKGNEIVNRALCIKAASLAAAPLRVYRKSDDEELPDHKLRMLFHNPNSWQSEYDLKEMISFHLDLAGNVYIQKVRNRGMGIAYLWMLRPDRVSVLINPSMGLVGYEHQYGASRQFITPEDMIHIKLNDPSTPWIGIPPMIAAQRRIAIDNEAADFAKSMLQNRAVPGLVIETDYAIKDKDVLDRLRKVWQQSFGGIRRGLPAFMQKGMSVKAISLNMQELAFDDLNATDEARILMALGVPPSVIGAKVGLDRNTFSNAEEARRSFYEDTIEPLMNRIDDIFDQQLVPEFGNDIYTKFDVSNVAAYRSIRESKRSEALDGLKSGGLTVNEYRVEMGLDQVSSGDVFLRGIAMIPTPINAKPIKELPPAKKSVDEDTHAALVARAIGRRDRGELWLDPMKEAARKEFKQQAADVVKAVENVPKIWDDSGIEIKKMIPEQITYIKDQLDQFNVEWAERIKKEFQPIMAEILKDAGTDAAADLAVDFLMDNQEVLHFIEDYTFKFAKGVTTTSVNDVRKVLDTAFSEGESLREMQTRLSGVFDGWDKYRTEMIARSETIRASNHGAEKGYEQAGVRIKEWLAAGDACDDCLELNGKTAAIGGNFLNLGDELPATGAKVGYEDIQTPPLHPNCRCCLTAVVE